MVKSEPWAGHVSLLVTCRVCTAHRFHLRFARYQALRRAGGFIDSETVATLARAAVRRGTLGFAYPTLGCLFSLILSISSFLLLQACLLRSSGQSLARVAPTSGCAVRRETMLSLQ